MRDCEVCRVKGLLSVDNKTSHFQICRSLDIKASHFPSFRSDDTKIPTFFLRM